MKKKNCFPGFLVIILITLFYPPIIQAQKPYYPKPGSDQILFDRKLPSPVLNATNSDTEKTLPYTSFDTVSKKFIVHTPGQRSEQNVSPLFDGNESTLLKPNAKPVASGFHLTKDINTATAASNPSNYPANSPIRFAVLNNVSYFTADDGVHGTELWRSDGTSAGTYLVKDINPGREGSDVSGIIAANGLLFFSANTADFGMEPWVSDGTESGTHLLLDLNVGISGSSPNQFVNVNGSAFFCASSFSSYNNQIWKTDGTQAGTILVKDVIQAVIGYGSIFELTAVNDMAFFIAYTYASGFQLLRTDGTDAGTYVVKGIGFYNFDVNTPTQLTAYNNKLYFSGNDGTGRRLWESDGTYEGTHYASGFNDVFLQPDYVSIYSNSPMLILNNVLYLSGYTYNDGSGLYKYDASNTDGIVLVKDLTPGTDIDFAVPVDMAVVNNVLYFKVISSVGDWHDELWSTEGETANTQLVKSFVPGEYTYFFTNGNGTLYFVEHDNVYGNELWKSDGTEAGTFLIKDIFSGPGSSYPEDLTFCGGKLLFKAFDQRYGIELWSSGGADISTALVRDINLAGDGSNAGFWYKGVGALGDGAVFNAFTPELGGELYKSDGTTAGTVLLNDIATGSDWSFPNAFLFKNNASYFISDDAVGTSIRKTNGTSASLQRITAYINRDDYYVVNFNVTDSGQVFYILGNKHTGAYELWHSDGTDGSGSILSPNINFISNGDYVVTIGNTALFAAGDFEHGLELWKSDGTVAGTKLVKDIYAGFNSSGPYSLFVYNKNVYFGAYDGFGFNNSLWKSDGTGKGTVKLKNVTPAYFNENFADPASAVFCVSNNILYFSATDFQTYGAELWKTNGTEAGTKMVSDINPYYSSYPSNLTDVKGILFFIADDGVHGTELWSSNGTSLSTKMVQDITPGFGYSKLYNLCSAGGKLYFLNGGTNPNTLWSSDGTAQNTNQVNDDVVNGLSGISHLTAAGDKLFFGGYSLQYGTELYEGDARVGTFAKINSIGRYERRENGSLDIILYPNPARDVAILQISGDAKEITVTVTDMAGRLIWQSSYHNRTQINLPTAKFSAGEYLVTVKSESGIKNLKLVKR